MSTPLQALEQAQLPASALGYLQQLPDEQADKLAQQILDSMKAKDERVERALNRALDVVPRPLRRTVRKMLFS